MGLVRGIQHSDKLLSMHQLYLQAHTSCKRDSSLFLYQDSSAISAVVPEVSDL